MSLPGHDSFAVTLVGQATLAAPETIEIEADHAQHYEVEQTMPGEDASVRIEPLEPASCCDITLCIEEEAEESHPKVTGVPLVQQ